VLFCSPSVSHLNFGVLVPTVSLLSVEYDTSLLIVAGDVAVRMFELIVNSVAHKLSLEIQSLPLPWFYAVQKPTNATKAVHRMKPGARMRHSLEG